MSVNPPSPDFSKKIKNIVQINETENEINDNACDNTQIFDTYKIEDLLQWELRTNSTNTRKLKQIKLKTFEQIFKDYHLFSKNKYNNAKCLYILYKKEVFTLEKIDKLSKKEKQYLDKYFFSSLGNVNVNEEKISKIVGKIKLLRTIFTLYWNDILLSTIKNTFNIIDYNINKYGFVEKEEINNIIFSNFLDLINLSKKISIVFKENRLSKKSKNSAYKNNLLNIENIIKIYVNTKKDIKECNVDKNNFIANKEELFNNMKEIIWDNVLGNIILDYWEILAEYTRWTVSYRNAVLVRQKKLNNPLLSITKFSLINEYLNENYLVNGANELSKFRDNKSIVDQNFTDELEIIDSSTEFIYSLLLAFGWQKILWTASDISLALKWSNWIVWEYFIFFKPYLFRFLKYNILYMFDVSEEQYSIISNIFNYYNVFNSKDSWVILIENWLNTTLPHLVERRNKSKLSSLIHNNFSFFRKISYKQDFKVNISFADIISKELNLDIENMLEEMEVDISWNKNENNILSLMLVDNEQYLEVLNLTKNIVYKINDIVNDIDPLKKKTKYWINYIIKHKEEIIDELYNLDTVWIHITKLVSLITDIKLYKSLWCEKILWILDIEELEEYIKDKDYITILIKFIIWLNFEKIIWELYNFTMKKIDEVKDDDNDIISFWEVEETIYTVVKKIFIN